MPLYMTQGAYTADAWRAMVQNPENREDALRGLLGQLGGRLQALYHTFGEYDVLAIFEAPDETTATAVVLAAVSAGHLKAVKTTPILTAQQAMEAMRKAGGQQYRAPGA